jgi:myo-inositol-1(or 4)-monophosphatase
VSTLSEELRAARQAALAGGAVLSRYWEQRTFTVASKGRDNPVTSADLEANHAIAAVLRSGFPQYGWLSEETADNRDRLEHDRVWIVDPLDGTKEFIQGVAEFCVSIGLADCGVPVLGVIYHPARGELYWAAHEEGCFLAERRVTVTKTASLREATVLASRSETKRGEWLKYGEQLKSVPVGSVAYKLARVAAGFADATFTCWPKNEWDVAAGAALVEAAGGRVTTLDGRPLRFNRKDVKISGMIASNGLLHGQLRDLIARHRRADDRI